MMVSIMANGHSDVLKCLSEFIMRAVKLTLLKSNALTNADEVAIYEKMTHGGNITTLA